MTAALYLGRSLDLWSLALAMLALGSLMWGSLALPSKICLLVSLFACSTQKALALRVAFDAALFRYWAEIWAGAATRGVNPAALRADLAELDQTLSLCGFRAPPDGSVRNLDSRLRGAGLLLRRQVLAFAIQFAAMIGAVVAMHLLPTD